ncbi:hypothetical protein IWQ60_000289 [Tieghemiomyces parasiticus]|uniref:BCAS3 WD40 domain-containing protein n=1 Tax=Tieghemiomyces parasiticus TaxID=78921 RepID=A0A9W8AIR1_9FUNG|nr:hypothetical protein IWQ60_000289 [Tieghemiomyces parasiticus]
MARATRWSGPSPQLPALPYPYPHPGYAASLAPYVGYPAAPVSPTAAAASGYALEPAEAGTDEARVLYAAFQDWPTEPGRSGAAVRLCLGYTDGFQIWDVADIDNIREVVSVRGLVEQVTQLRLLHLPPGSSTARPAALPWAAVVHSATTTSSSTEPVVDPIATGQPPSLTSAPPTGNALSVISLADQQLVRTYRFAPARVVETAAFGPLLAVVLDDGTLHLLDVERDRETAIARFDDVHVLVDVTTPSQRIALGPRYLAFPTIQPAPVKVKLSPVDEPVWSPHPSHAVGKVAKDVVNGVRVLGSFGYRKLSNYFGTPPPSSAYSSYPARPLPGPYSGTRAAPPSFRPPLAPGDSREESPVDIVPGTVIMYDLQEIVANLDDASDRPSSVVAAPVAHFTCHTHPVGCLTFNANHTLLATVSTQGHALNVYAVLGPHDAGFFTGGPAYVAPAAPLRGVRQLYRLSRGITDAAVESVTFSPDACWLAASTARGTTHVFPINPRGGPIDAPAHLGPATAMSPLDAGYSLANGSSVWKADLTTVAAVARLKQKAPRGPVRPGDPAYPALQVPYHAHATPEDPGLFAMELPDAPGHPRFQPARVRAGLVTCFAPFYARSQWYATLHGQYYPSTSFGTSDPSAALTPPNRLRQLIQPLLLWVFHPEAGLTLHRLTPTCVVQKGRGVGSYRPLYSLAVTRDDLAEWDVVRRRAWPEVALEVRRQSLPATLHPARANSTAAPTRKQKPARKQGSARAAANQNPAAATPSPPSADWLANVELVTCPLINPEPLWAHPQVQLQVIVTLALGGGSEVRVNGHLRRSPHGTTSPLLLGTPGSTSTPWCPPVRPVEIRRGALRPYGTASMDRGETTDGDDGQVRAGLHNAMNSVLDRRAPLDGISPALLAGADLTTVSPLSDDFMAVDKAPMAAAYLYTERQTTKAGTGAMDDPGMSHLTADFREPDLVDLGSSPAVIQDAGEDRASLPDLDSDLEELVATHHRRRPSTGNGYPAALHGEEGNETLVVPTTDDLYLLGAGYASSDAEDNLNDGAGDMAAAAVTDSESRDANTDESGAIPAASSRRQVAHQTSGEDLNLNLLQLAADDHM